MPVVGLWAGLLASFLMCSRVAACDLELRDAPILAITLSVHGRQPVRRDLHLAPDVEYVVLVQEQGGLDVTLELIDAQGLVVRRADNPIRRTGAQRLAFVSHRSDYVVAITGKEHAAASGRVALRVARLGPSADDTCSRVQRRLAEADAAYADGQAIARGAGTASSKGAAASYASAVRLYGAIATEAVASQDWPIAAGAEHATAAVLYHELQDWNAAVGWAQRAAETYRKAGDAYDANRAQAIEAEALMETRGKSVVATAPAAADDTLVRCRQLLRSIAAFHARRGEAYEQALALTDIGLSYYLEDAFKDALRNYDEALPLFVARREQLHEAIVLQNIALIESDLGHLSTAIPHYARVLSLISREENPILFARILNNSALVNARSRKTDVALQQYAAAVSLAGNIQDHYEESISLYGIGLVYDALGDRELALEFYNRALPPHGSERDVQGRVACLRAIANLRREQGDAQLALSMHREALSLAAAPSTQARIRLQIARDLAALGERKPALDEIEALLRLGSADQRVRASALLERSHLSEAAGDYVSAETDVREALRTLPRGEAPVQEFEMRVALAHLMHRRGADRQALASLDRALQLAEDVRLQSANPELRATLFQPLRPAFDLKIAILAEQYFAGHTTDDLKRIALQALMASEQARARALADFQDLDLTAPQVPPDLAEERHALFRELADRRQLLETTLDLSGDRDPRVEVIRAEIALLREKAHQLDARIAAAAPPQVRERRDGALDPRAVPPDTAVVEYWLGSEGAFAWVLTRDDLVMYRLAGYTAINEAARAFHAALRDEGATPPAERMERGSRLYQLILAPLAGQVVRQHTLIFAADGALHYVPFAALPTAGATGTSFLVSSHDIAVAPSIGTLLRTGGAPEPVTASKELLLVADPVYGRDDPRLARVGGAPPRTLEASVLPPALRRRGGDSDLPRLPATAKEAETVLSVAAASSGVDSMQGFAASRERFLATDLSQYRIIHIASHAFMDSEIPQLSAVILSTFDSSGRSIDGRVMASDLLQRRLHADVVVLSGCETALGKDVLGEGLIGLRYVALARGARSVISSLWQVSDADTAGLMRRLYVSLFHDEGTVAVALANAMRSMIADGHSDPAEWAGFDLTISDFNGRSFSEGHTASHLFITE
jgi:CHAT domain-containing protein